MTTLTFPKQEWSQGHCSTALGADRVAGDFPGVSTCPVFYTLNRSYIKHPSDGWVSRVQVSGGLGAWGGQQGHLVREMETSNRLPQGFWDRDWRGILGRTVRPSGLPSLLSWTFPILSPFRGLQRQSKTTTGTGSQSWESTKW